MQLGEGGEWGGYRQIRQVLVINAVLALEAAVLREDGSRQVVRNGRSVTGIRRRHHPHKTHLAGIVASLVQLLINLHLKDILPTTSLLCREVVNSLRQNEAYMRR